MVIDSEQDALRNPEVVDLVRDKLEELRKRLLDFSRRNPLININFRPNSSSVMRVVDELPDILRHNLTNGTAMRLVPLPALKEELPDEQTDAFQETLFLARKEDEEYLAAIDQLDTSTKDAAEQELKIERALKDRVREGLGLPERQTKEDLSLTKHATAHGISPDYTLPLPEDEHEDGRHTDTDIQTLMLPDKLSRTSKSIRERGRSFERETGVNVLHAAFGLLEWKSETEKDRFASPLLLLEIRIDRKQSPSGVRFFINGVDRVFVNTTLAQKFLSEYKLVMPDYESGSVEDYFEEVADAAPQGWHWQVRREVAFGIFPSSKIAMYHDLDPRKRPLAENLTVAKLLATTGTGSGEYAEEYSTDDPEIVKKVPHLVMDADASQYSSLVDVAEGKNLAIEGPPGSGKSQTIVNMIAAALADGKKVLFVAEKLNALDVVKNRLEAVGLGEFILPLQAGRSSRENVYESLEERMYLGRGAGSRKTAFQSRQGALERKRATLQNYLDTLGTLFGTTGMNVFEIIGHGIATNDIRETVPKEVRRIRISGVEDFGPEKIEGLIGDAEAFAARLGRLDRMPKLWLDAQAMILNHDEAEDVCELAGQIADRLEAYAKEISASDIAPLVSANPLRADMEQITGLLRTVASQADRIDPVLVEMLTDTGKRKSVRNLCGQIRERKTAVARLARVLKEPDGWNIEKRLEAALVFARENGEKISPASHRTSIEEMESEIETSEALLAAAAALPRVWVESGQDLQRIQSAARELLTYPDEVTSLRIGDPTGEIAATGQRLIDTKENLAAVLSLIRQGLPKAGRHKPSGIFAAAGTIEQSGAFRFLSGNFKAARNTYANELGGNRKDDRATMAERLKAYASFLKRVEVFEKDANFHGAFGSLFQGLSTSDDLVRQTVAFYEATRTASGGSPEIAEVLQSGDLSALAPLAEAEDAPAQTVAELEKSLNTLRRQLEKERTLLEEAENYISLIHDRDEILADEIADVAAHKVAEMELTALIEESPAGTVIGERFRGISTDIQILETECELAETILEAPDPALAISILRSGQAPELVSEAERFSERLTRLESDSAEFGRSVGLPEDMHSAGALAGRLDDLRAAASDPSALMERARLKRAEITLRELGFDILVDWSIKEGADLDPASLGPIVRAIIAKNMTDRAYDIHHDALQGYSGEDFDRIRAETAQKDRQLIKMSREVIRNQLAANSSPPAGNNIGRKSTFTDMSLIINEMHKKRNRVGVRELTRRAGAALLELKPCWMMSPLAVSQYLHEEISFDLVVIDEASQMTPENAIGAISRAKQTVIVGDTKQLPPTSFFQKLLDETDIDEDLREDNESILDMANVTFMPVRQLRWHYRSRHSGLIQFSNKWMYDSKLTIFPSAEEDHPDLGVNLVQTNGIYKSRTNEIEARAVVTAAIRHMETQPDLSLGICTMNIDQKDLILEEFERERDRNRKVQDYVGRWEKENDALEEFFIKNLETIQGDERDVMFISTLYGPETPGGRPHQRFGPINSVNGHRRLNVLFTRAKRKIVTFTSLLPSDILVDENKNKGVRMFRAWLEYCKTGFVADDVGAGGDTDSPFEDYVIRQIESLGCEAVPQVGSAGYSIDIGVRHPDWPHGFIMGVECDGAPFHSSKSSRDRDRLRQEVLEGLGWHLHRIWSTDWYNDPRSQRDILKEKIDARMAALKAEDHRRSKMRADDAAETGAKEMLSRIAETAKSDTDAEDAAWGDRARDGVDDATNRAKTQAASHLRARPSQQSLSIDDPTGDDLFNYAMTHAADEAAAAQIAKVIEDTDPIVEVGSKVTVERLSDMGGKMMFTIVDRQNDPDNGLVGSHTPLGQALIDAQKGDEVEYVVGSYVKKVRIISVEPTSGL